MEGNKEQVLDVRSVVESISVDDDSDTPIYQVESLCMRCSENVLLSWILSTCAVKLFHVISLLSILLFLTGSNKVYVDDDSALQKGIYIKVIHLVPLSLLF